MPILAVLAEPDNQKLETAITEGFPEDFVKIRPGQWLVSAELTAQELSGKLLITDGTNGAGVVVSIGSYFGRANPNLWEWIRTKWDKKHG